MTDHTLLTFGNDPIALFSKWFEEAQAQEINDPETMCLSTADSNGKPSNRMVLLKDFSDKGFKFHTNSESQKGSEILDNPQAALCFYWKSTRKQVRVEGPVEMVSTEEADEYFASRPRERQIGAWASSQSRILRSREELEKALQALEEKYKDQDIPRPPYWNGYIVIPQSIEFWIGNEHRLHDRFIYYRKGDGWEAPQWLYP